MQHPLITRLKIKDQPYITICHALGGIHKVLQVLDILTSRTEFFMIHNPISLRDSGKNLRDADVKQYCLSMRGIDKLTPYSRVWKSCDWPEVTATTVFMVSEFLDELEYAINHGIHVPENIYYQTMSRIELLRGKKNPAIKLGFFYLVFMLPIY